MSLIPKKGTVYVVDDDEAVRDSLQWLLEGKDYRVRGNYREVVAPERLVIECTADDDKGIARLEEIINVTFAENHGKTTLTVHAIASGQSAEAAAMLEGMPKGWAQTVDRLGAHLKPSS